MPFPVATRIVLGAAVTVLGAACSYPRTPDLSTYDLAAGYRFDSLALDRAESLGTNSDEIFVILAFSGGGTRAASLSYGVLEELERIKFRLDPTTGEPCSRRSCPDVVERSLLDEVDVISSVSGGSFTAAYFALNGKEILESTSPFKEEFLYYPVQRQLAGNLLFKPRSWKWLGSRVELAADYHRSFLGDAEFGDLSTRPYLILNSTDATTGGRFEFTQNQFDLLCADLAKFPLRRAVAASSAFPVLLNSMTIDSYQPAGRRCGYRGPGDWLDNALGSRETNLDRFKRAEEIRGYLDESRPHIHLLDGGVADNVGLRAILRSLGSIDGPAEAAGPAPNESFGGWSVLRLVNRSVFGGRNPQIKKVVVVAVNARTDTEKDWDTKRSGPNSLSLLNVAAGIPIGRLTNESTYLLRQAEIDHGYNEAGAPELYAFNLTFENITDPDQRDFFLNLGTNFQLTRFAVDCLVDRGGSLLRESRALVGSDTLGFSDFVGTVLESDSRPGTGSRDCTAAQADQSTGVTPHIINAGPHYAFGVGSQAGVRLEDRLGFSFRVARPTGLGALFSFGPRTFDITGPIGGVDRELGDFRLWAMTLGVGYTFRAGPLDITPGVTGGYGLGSFELEDGVRQVAGEFGLFELDVEAPGSWMAQAEIHAWLDVHTKFALTGFAQYAYAKPFLQLADPATTLFSQALEATGIRLGVGLGYRVY